MLDAVNFNPPDGSVVLRGIVVALASDIGQGFVLDCARYCEEVLTEDEVKTKYKLSDTDWARLAENEPLQQAVRRQRERRVNSGDCAREKAQRLFLTAPDVLGGILNNIMAPARSRIEAAKELRQVALGGSEVTPTSERFVITINLGEDYKLLIDKPIAPGPEPDDKPLTIESEPDKKAEDDGDEPV